MEPSLSPPLVSPVIFTARGLKHDVLLRAFEIEFHVHSVVLRLHSAFFFKFLDSPDKTIATSAGGPQNFKYEWATKVDKDGTWSMVAAASIKPNENNVDTFKGNKDEEIRAFEKFLRAIYGEPWNLTGGSEELVLMTKMADYYCALPALSKCLNNALIRSNIDIGVSAMVLLEPAFKLRHPELYRECLMFVAGKFDTPFDLKYLSPELQKNVELTRSQIYRQVLVVVQQLLEYSTLGSDVVGNGFVGVTWVDSGTLPRYYRFLMKKKFGSMTVEVVNIIKQIIARPSQFNRNDNVVLDKKGSPYEDYFFCSFLKTERLPWDATQLDW